MVVVFFTKFSQQKGRKDLEAIGMGMYLCPPAEKTKQHSSLPG
jgi:hypothetical protein